jgi:hypothetical protein
MPDALFLVRLTTRVHAGKCCFHHGAPLCAYFDTFRAVVPEAARSGFDGRSFFFAGFGRVTLAGFIFADAAPFSFAPLFFNAFSITRSPPSPFTYLEPQCPE